MCVISKHLYSRESRKITPFLMEANKTKQKTRPRIKYFIHGDDQGYTFKDAQSLFISSHVFLSLFLYLSGGTKVIIISV